MTAARAVLATANFERNLEAIDEFLSGSEGEHRFGELVRRLASHVIPSLQRFPEMGADFLTRAPLSADGRALFEKVVRSSGPQAQVRQLIDGEYVLLYLVKDGAIYLLSFKHHRQLSFDFADHWP